MNSVFNEQILADKLAKLNTTQQCIETLSHWCIFHRSKAELVVSTWDKQFHKSEMVHKVPLLYLANDILQNSKRKGNEFVTEFWKVLPAALKDVHENGNEQGKSVVSRLVDIWEQRRVFGSRAKSLKDLMLGDEGPPPLELTKKRSRTVRIVKRDSRSIRTKLAIGGAAEKIVSAFHLVLSEHPNEDAEMSKCKSSVQRVRKLETDVEIACAIVKNPRRQILAKELEEEEKALKQCIEKLKSVEASRVALVSQLKEALHEQESELENIRTQMQVAEAQVDEASNMRKRLNDEDFVLTTSTSATLASESNGKLEQSKKSAAAIAAEVADRLAASSSSQMIMTSVLSTFAAQEAKNVGLTKGLPSSSSFSSACAVSDSNSVQVSDLNGFTRRQQLVTTPSHSFPSVMVPQQTMQSQLPASQAQYHVLSNPSSQQYMQPAGGVISPYAYSNIPPLPPGPPPPPHPPHILNSMVSLPQQPLISQQQAMHLSQQHMTQHQQIPIAQLSVAPNFRPIQPPGMVYYGNSHHSG